MEQDCVFTFTNRMLIAYISFHWALWYHDYHYRSKVLYINILYIYNTHIYTLYTYIYTYIYISPFPRWCSPNWASHSDSRGESSTVDVYTRSDISTQTCAWLLAAGQLWVPPQVTLYLSPTCTLAHCYLHFSILSSLVTSLTFFLKLLKKCDTKLSEKHDIQYRTQVFQFEV